MPNNTTNYGRVPIAWPDLASDGGATLHSQITTAISQLSDHLPSRWSGSLSLNNAASTTITHNFGHNVTSLKVLIVENGTLLTQLQVQAGYTITNINTNSYSVTNNTGSTKTVQIYTLVKLGIWENDLDKSKDFTGMTITNSELGFGTASNTNHVGAPQDTLTNLTALTRKKAAFYYDTTNDRIVFDTGAALFALATSTGDSSSDIRNTTVACSVGSNALTIALKTKTGGDPSGSDSVQINFRNSTLSTGTYATVTQTSALSMVVSSGSTLGHESTVEYPIFVYALNNAGTIELAVSTSLVDTTKLWSTTAEGGAGAADSSNVIYSTTARTNVALRLIGVLKSTQTTAGTWAAIPTQDSPNFQDYTPARNVVGDRSGTAVPAGMIGELKSATTTAQNAAASATYLALTSISLTPGTWLISGYANFIANGATMNITAGSEVLVSNTSAAVGDSVLMLTRILAATPSTAATEQTEGSTIPYLISINSTTTYYLNALTRYTAGTPLIRGGITAIRIA